MVVPMAGAGSRFSNSGYSVPKPLIDVAGAPMVKRAVHGAGIDGRLIYIVQGEHSDRYNLTKLLPEITPLLEVLVLEVDGITDGAAASVLVAKEYIDNDSPLVICDSDGIVEWDSREFLADASRSRDLDGSIAVFLADTGAWSYVSTDSVGLVTKVSEKDPISTMACAGIYYWKSGSNFVSYAEKLINEDKRIRGEFYVAPVYNEAIMDGKRVGVYLVDSFSPLGTPEHLDAYMETVKPWIGDLPLR